MRAEVAPLRRSRRGGVGRGATKSRATCPGVIVEDKRWTLSVHYRLADPTIVPGSDRSSRAASRSELGLRLTTGKEVLELRPPVDVNKGTAAVELAAPTRRARRRTHRSSAPATIAPTKTCSAQLRARSRARVTVRVGDDRPHRTVGRVQRVPTTDEMRVLLEQIARQRRAASGRDASAFRPSLPASAGFAPCLAPWRGFAALCAGFAATFARLCRGLRRLSAPSQLLAAVFAGRLRGAFGERLCTFAGSGAAAAEARDRTRRRPERRHRRGLRRRSRRRFGLCHRRLFGGDLRRGRTAPSRSPAASRAPPRPRESACPLLPASSGRACTMYCTRSRALSIAKPAIPAPALITSFIAAATFFPASWLISCARSAISATVSRMSAPRWPGPRRGAGTERRRWLGADIGDEGVADVAWTGLVHHM